MHDRTFVFRSSSGPEIYGFGSDREAADYLNHLNRNGEPGHRNGEPANRYICRPSPPQHSGRVLLLSLALLDIAETEPS